MRSKFSIHVLLVCATSDGEIGISLRSFLNLNSLALDKRFDNWLEKVVSFFVRTFIDDIIFIWTDGEDSLKEFLGFCQKYDEKRI